MRPTPDPEVPKLCNNCLLREERRNPKKDIMETVDILIKCPAKDQAEIEEYCMKNGLTFTQYFMNIHYSFKAATNTVELVLNDQKMEEKTEIPEKDTSERRQEGKRQKRNSVVLE